MGRTAKNNTPNLKPVQKVELSEKHFKLRLAAAVLLLAMAAVTLTKGITSLLSREAGWNTVSASSSTENCGSEFVFKYYFEGRETAVSAEYKKLSRQYSEICENAYRLFSNSAEFDGVNNVKYINLHPNEEINVDSVLYNAFSLLAKYENRDIYLAPVYECYSSVFASQTDIEAKSADPLFAPEVKSFIDSVTRFTKNADDICLKLLGDNTVKLCVSEDYLSFAKENEISSFIDFYRLKNAFIADYIAKELVSAGYKKGNISSFDGFTRNLDDSDTEYSLKIIDKRDSASLPLEAAVMDYKGDLAIVYFKAFRLSDLDAMYCFLYENGESRTAYINSDGESKTANNMLVAFSKELGCAEILLNTSPYYIAESFGEEQASALKNDGVFTVWCSENTVNCTCSDVSFSAVLNGYTVKNF